jgi:Calcineurin-like phosphoesterase
MTMALRDYAIVAASLISAIVAVHLLLLQQGRIDSRKPRLSFDEHGSFKILQLTDLHLGEDPFTNWAPLADRKTFRLIRHMIQAEQPDLVVLSGDQLTGNNVDTNSTVYYDMLAAVIQEFAVPYAMIFGNHDDMDFAQTYPDGTVIQHPAKTLRRELMRSDRRHRYSLSQEGPTSVNGVSNYVLDVFRGEDIKLQIMLLDSGGGSMEEEIVANQMQWYQSRRILGVDAVAFQHIPTKEFRYKAGSCIGLDGEGDTIDPLHKDPVSEISYLLQTDSRLHFLAVGHNHGNSYCCPASNTSNLHLCFGRHSGFGGYGKWERGARVYQLACQSDDSISWSSWVRLETEAFVDDYEPLPSVGSSAERRRERLPPNR